MEFLASKEGLAIICLVAGYLFSSCISWLGRAERNDTIKKLEAENARLKKILEDSGTVDIATDC